VKSELPKQITIPVFSRLADLPQELDPSCVIPDEPVDVSSRCMAWEECLVVDVVDCRVKKRHQPDFAEEASMSS